MIKMYAFDLDGTLLKSDQTIDQATVELLHKMKEDGKNLVIATGRAKGIMEEIVLEYNLDFDLLLNNGHETIVKGREIKYVPFDWDILEKVLTILKKYDMHLTACASHERKYSFCDKDTYYDRHIEMSKAIRNGVIEDMNQPLFRKDSYTKNFNHAPEVVDYKSVKMLKIDAKTLDKEVKRKCIRKLETIPELMLSSSYEAYIEIIQNNTDKGKALVELGKSYGIDPSEIAAFGDGHNDIEMLSMVGHSCAMGNAFDEVKEVARYVTDTNDNQGVYKQLLKMLEIE